MYKKKRLFGLFAIMFVAIFSVGCVFATACKKNKESDEETETQHVHAYTELHQDGANGHYYTCPDDDAMSEVTAHTYGAWTTTKAATCGDYGTQTRSCTVCGYKETDTETLAPTGDHTYTSESVAHFDWTNFDEVELSGVTATVECDVCHTAADADSVTVAAVGGEEDTYVATAKIGDAEIVSAKHKVGEVEFENLFIDVAQVSTRATYSSEATLGSNAFAAVSVTANSDYTVSIDSSSKTDSGLNLTFTNRLKLGGEGTTEYRSIKIVLTEAADVTVWMMSSNSAASNKRVANFFDGQGATIYQKIGVQGSSLDRWTVSFSEAGTYYFGSASSGLNIYGIAVSEYSGKYESDLPGTNWAMTAACTETSVAVDGTLSLTATVTCDDTPVTDKVTLSWSSSDETVAKVAGVEDTPGSGTITAIAAGTTGITVSCKYGNTEDAKVTSTAITVTVTDGTGEGGSENPGSEDTYTITITSNETEMVVGDSISLGATVKKGSEAVSDATVTWTVTNETGTSTPLTDSTFTPETAGTYTITATYTPEGGEAVVSMPITITVVEKDPIAGTEWKGTAYYDIAAVGLETTLKSDVKLTVSDDGKFSLEIGNASATGGALDIHGGIAAGIVNKLLPDVDLSDMEYTRDGSDYTVHIYEEDLGGDIYIYATLGEDRGCEYLSVSFSITMDFDDYGEGTLTVTNQRVWLNGDEPAAVTGVTFGGSTEHVVTATAQAGAFESELTFTVTDAESESYPQAEWTGSQAWTSSDKTVATVDGLGNITLTGTPGVAVITVTVDECSASYVIVVGATEIKEDDAIYGEWAGDADEFVVTYVGDLLGVIYSDDYTITSTVGIEASADGIAITLTIVSAGSYESGAEVVICGDAKIYCAGDSYYVILFADGVAYISEMTIEDGQLSGTFAASTSFKVTSSRTYTGDIEFTATLEKLAGARFAAATGSATLADGNNSANFENGEISLTVTSRSASEVTYEIAGIANVMTDTQAEVFWNGTAGVGDAYVIITVTLVEGETISWTSPDGNTKSYSYSDLSEDDGVLEIIIRISGTQIGTEIGQGYASYTITDSENKSVTHTVYFSDVEIPDVAEGLAMAVPSEADITLSGSEAVFNNRENFDIEYQGNGVYIATGEANIMDETQAEAYWSGVAQAGDAYIIVRICIEVGQTVYYGDNSREKENENDDLALIIRLVGAEGGTGSTVFTVKNEAGDTVAIFTVDYSGVVIPDVDESGSIVEDRIGLVPANETVELTDEYINKTASFINNDTLEVALEKTDDGKYVFVVAGTAEIMTSDQAEVFWNGVAEEGDAYVIIVVYLNVGETISFGEKSWTKTGDDELEIIMRLTAAGTTSFVVTNNEGTEVLSFVVDFSGVTIPQNGQLGRTAASTADELTEAIANGAESVIILADIELTEALEIEGNVTITLKENAVLSNSATGVSVITVTGDASLTITGEGKVAYTGTDTNTSTDNTAAIFSTGTLVIEGGATIESSSVGVRAEGGSVTITNATISSTYFTIWTDAGDVTVTINAGSVIKGVNKGIFLGGDNGNFGITPEEVAENAKSTLIVNGGTITCENESAISTLAKCNAESVVIVIYDGEVTGTSTIPADTVTGAAPAIYIPSGTLYIVGGTITGTTAVEVRGGSTTIYGGTLISTACPLNEEQKAENTGHGATTYGYSLAVFPYGQGVTVSGQTGYADNAITVLVYGGTFVGAVYGVDYETWYGETGSSYTWVGYTFEITGGTFSENPSAYVATGYKAHEITEEEAENYGWYTVDEAQTELAIIGSTSTSQNSEITTVTTEAGTVTAKYTKTTETTNEDGETTTTTEIMGPNYKSDNKVEINGVEYNPIKQEGNTSIEIATTTACTVTIVCRGKYTAASEDSAASWNNPGFTISGVAFTTEYDEDANLWYYSFEAEANQTYSLIRTAEDLIYAVAFTY